MVLVTDWSKFKIYQFDPSGKHVADLANTEIDFLFESTNKKIAYYEAISVYSMIAFIVVLLLGVIAAFILEKQQVFRLIIASFWSG